MNPPVFYAFQPDLSGVLSLFVTVVLPLVIGLVTKRSTSAALKSVLLLLAAYVTAVLQAWITAIGNGEAFAWQVTVYNGIINFVIAIAVHFGVWKPTGVTSKAQDTLNHDTDTAKHRRYN